MAFKFSEKPIDELEELKKLEEETRKEEEKAKKEAEKAKNSLINFDDHKVSKAESLGPGLIQKELKKYIENEDLQSIVDQINEYKNLCFYEHESIQDITKEIKSHTWENDSEVANLASKFYPLIILDEDSEYNESESGIKIKVSYATKRVFAETILGLSEKEVDMAKTFVIATRKSSDCEAFSAKLDIWRSISEGKIVFIK